MPPSAAIVMTPSLEACVSLQQEAAAPVCCHMAVMLMQF